MRDTNERPNFTFLWAIGALAALGWVFEPVLGQAIQSGGGLGGRMVLDNPLGLWMRGAVTGLFVLLGLYEQHTLARMESRSRGYRAVLDALPDVVWTARAGGPRQFLSPNAARVLGYAPEMLAKDEGRLWWDAIHPDDRPTVRRAYDSLFASDAPYAIEYRLRRPDGTWSWVGERSVLTFVRDGVRHANGVVCDVNQRKLAEEANQLASRFDPLTSLPGRDLLHDRLGQALAYARRHRLQVAVLYLGFAGLAETTETLGRGVAEPLLKEVANRLGRVVREEDTLARHDDSHLVIVLPAIPEARHASRVTRAVIEALDTVIEVRGQPLSLGVNVGLSFFPTDGDDPETLVKHAASAMGRSRRQGRNAYELYTPDMHHAAVRRLHLEAGLRRAVERGELELHFQPQFDLLSGRVAGVEALLRWNSPDSGQVSPGEFIPIAEETGLVVPVGAWVLKAACQQASRWRKAGLAPGRMAVNVSARQLEGDTLARTVAAALKETGLPPECLELEITESALVRNAEEAGRSLEAIRRMGVGLAVDDFGTGHAALAYLRRFPIETLKIDRTFVAPCAGDPEDGAIVQAVIAMAHSLRLRVVAEGVETEAQLAFLKANGCDAAQGFLLARPAPAEAAGRFLADAGEARRAGA